MKHHIFTTLIMALCLLSSSGFAQRSANDNVARLQTLLKAVSDTSMVRLLENQHVLQINQRLIPLAETTLVDWEKVDGGYAVQFFLQKGTAIIDVTNPKVRRAYWAVKLPSKQSCQTFVALFDRLKAEQSKM